METPPAREDAFSGEDASLPPPPAQRGEGQGGGRVEIFDTTLRDGSQREGISWSVADKLRIAARLDDLGVDVIEGGWPGSNPKDAAFFAAARRAGFRHAALCAFGATCRAGARAEDDANLEALLAAETPVCAIFGKSSPFQVEEILRTTRAENLRIIEHSVRRLVAAGRRVIYDAEHFFDGWRQDRDYALATLQAAVAGGADTLALCDTNGGSLPWEVAEIVAQIDLAARLGIHAHDDSGCAVASSLAAVRAGARHVQGTINGYGERCGNANLCSIVPGLALKLGHQVLRPGSLRELPEVARLIAELANLSPDDHAPYVGRSAFAHKGGVHVAAVRRSADAYQHIDPAAVGNQTRVVVSDLAGRGSLIAKAEELGLAGHDDQAGRRLLAALKEEEADGFAFDAADGSVAVRLRRLGPAYQAPFALVAYRVTAGRRGDDDAAHAEATLKVEVGGEVVHTAAEGDGPVHALDAALRKALLPAYPHVGRITLDDYKVRILDGRAGTRAVTRVLIDFSDHERRWTTVGASASILEATWLALADGLEHGLACVSATTLLEATK